jgi:alpha-mannosidase
MESVSLKLTPSVATKSAFKVEGNVLTTPFYQATFDGNGYISELIDLQADRQINREGGVPLGTLWSGEDMPFVWDNWDIDDDIFSKLNPITDMISREVVTDGSVEYRVRAQYKVGKKSTATVDTVFYADDRRIDYDVKVDWNERHTLLKAGFDVNIRSAFIKNEIQFGHLDRPTTRNSSLEASKFEICNHKWSDLSETHYGVAILNNCKYGLSAEGSDLRLTLHKGGCRPDPFTDNGVHTMTYSLLPHMGAFDAETVIQPAYELNYQPVVVEGELKAPKLFSLSNPGVICEAVKSAEDVEGAYVLRLYEAERNTSNCILTLNGAKRVWATNMLEEKQEELPVVNGKVKLTFRPFEIKTILVER